MMRYQLLSRDQAGCMLGSKVVECTTDGEAIAVAEQWFGAFARIEVWNESRPVCLCFKPDQDAHVAISSCPIEPQRGGAGAL